MNTGNRYFSLFYLLLFFISSFVILQIVPPFQSPDESNHFYRAYSFSQGEIIVKGGVSDIDASLVTFDRKFSYLAFHSEHKVSNDILNSKEYWNNQKVSVPFPNTAVYFPLTYTPQATAIMVGKIFNLSINSSYYLARLLALLCCVFCLYSANKIYRMPAAVSILFLMPMVVFQAASTSQDALAFSVSAVIAALFCKAFYSDRPFSNKDFLVLSALIFILVTSRINLTPLAILPFLIAYQHKQKKWYVLTVLNIALVCAWILIAMKIVEADTFFNHGMTSGDKLKVFLSDPVRLLNYYWTTFTNKDLMQGYLFQYIGVLGWLDTPLRRSFYNFVLIFMPIFGWIAISCNPKAFLKSINNHQAWLTLLMLLASVLLTFFILLLAWTNILELNHIAGVQGRYFIPIVIIATYILFAKITVPPLTQKVLTCLILVFFCYSISATSTTLIKRYYMQDTLQLTDK